MTTYQNHFTNRKHRHTGSDSFSRFVEDILNTNIGEMIENVFQANRAFVNVLESENAFEVHVAAPGLTKTDFKIEVKDGLLHVSADKQAAPAEGIEVKRREFDFGKFHRTFKLDERVDASQISAKYDQGVLIVTLPKRAKDTWKREIHVD